MNLILRGNTGYFMSTELIWGGGEGEMTSKYVCPWYPVA